MTNIAYAVDLRGEPMIIEFAYKNKTDKSYMGCEKVRDVLGRSCYLSGRIGISGNVVESLSHAFVLCGNELIRRKAVIEKLQDKLGEAIAHG
jgi:hypothetical protein